MNRESLGNLVQATFFLPFQIIRKSKRDQMIIISRRKWAVNHSVLRIQSQDRREDLLRRVPEASGR
jgi:hypothetical protein